MSTISVNFMARPNSLYCQYTLVISCSLPVNKCLFLFSVLVMGPVAMTQERLTSVHSFNSHIES